MTVHVIFVGTYEIPDGAFAEFLAANRDMADFDKANEPRLISWHTYINEDYTEATTVMVHPDSASLEYHLQVAASRIQGGVQLVRTKRMDLYGKVSDHLLQRLRQISDKSGAWPVTVKMHLHGFPD